MIQYMLEQYKESQYTYKSIVIFFALLTLWWISIFLRGLTEGLENDLFTVTYPMLSLIGGILGWSFAKKWGGWKSALGRTISFFTLGLLAQFIAQILYIYYIYILGVEVPYPSLGDIVSFGSVLFYIYAVILLSKVSGIKLSMKSYKGKVKAFIIPLVILILSYWIFLRGYEPDMSNLPVLFFDFAFPIGQAIYVSFAILALLISKDILGGLMRKPITFLILALILQYVADFGFSYQVSRETWYVGGINDYLYCLSYFIMTIALFSIGNMFYKVQKT